jgi:beta-lactamase regulating signal transducer with metallopeptidase domain
MSVLTHSALLRALGWSLFNSLWQMSLLWAAFHFLLLIFNRLPARSRHGLALFMLTIGAGWSALTFFGAYCFPQTVPQHAQWLSNLLPAPAIGGALSRISQWLVSGALALGSSAYLIILSALMLRYLSHYIRSRQITRTGLSRISPEFRVFTSSTARQMGIRATVGVYLSSLVDVPVTLGFLKPVILLPVAMITHLRTEQIEAILVHELAHIRRKDYLLNLMVTVLELLFFFNPFTRMLVSRLKKEREHCCDDQVLEFRYDPHAYISALLSLARQHRQGRLALAAIGGGGDKLLLQRARKMLQQKKQVDRPGPRTLLFLFLLLSLGAGSFGVSLGVSADPSQPGQQARPRSGDRAPNIDPAREQLGLFIPVSPVSAVSPASLETTRILGAPLAAMATPEVGPGLMAPAEGHPMLMAPAEVGPVLTSPARHHRIAVSHLTIALNRIARKQPAGIDEFKALVLYTVDPDVVIQPDTISPKAKLAWMELMAEKDFRIQVMQLQTGLRMELAYLSEQQASAQKAIMVQMRIDVPPGNDVNPGNAASANMEQLLKEFLQRQLQLQQQYEDRMDELQRQWLKMGRRLTIVYI